MKHIIFIIAMLLCVNICSAQADGRVNPDKNITQADKNSKVNVQPAPTPSKSELQKDKNNNKDTQPQKGNAQNAKPQNEAKTSGQTDQPVEQYSDDPYAGDNVDGNVNGNIDDIDSATDTSTDAQAKAEEPAKAQTSILNYAGLLAIVLCIILFFYVNSRTKKDKAKSRRAKDMEADIHGQIDEIYGHIQNLGVRISNLENNLASLKKSVNALSSQSDSNARQQSTQIRQDYERKQQPIQKETLYASAVLADTFPSNVLKKSADKSTLFILTIAGNEGTYIVNDDTQQQSSLISTFQFNLTRAVNLGHRANSPQTIVTVEPGIIKKTGDGWQITKKARVDLR